MIFFAYSYGMPVVSAAEHSSVLEAASIGEGRYCALAPDEDGTVSPECLREKLTARFGERPAGDRMASFMLANNETGAVNNVKALAETAHEWEMWFHTDATAAAGAMRIDAKDLGVDFMTFSAHKMHGPKGAAAIYCREPPKVCRVLPYTGTPDVPAIVGFGEACRIQNDLIRQSGTRDADYDGMAADFLISLERGLESGYELNIPEWTPAHFNRVMSVQFAGVDAETLVMLSSQRGLMISAGAACESNEKKPSHVLTAVGLTDDEARSSVRVSFSRMTTEKDCVDGGAILADCVNQLRRMRDGY